MVLVHMAGEISPDMMFWTGRQKMPNMGADGHRLVWMGAVGLVGMGGTPNSKKKFKNGCVGQHLVTHDNGKKLNIILVLSKPRKTNILSIPLVR